MKKALSPMVSVIILVVISISLASFIAPWMYELVSTTANDTQTETETQIMCRNAGLDFDSEYGQYGVSWNFTGNGSDWLKAKVVNTGTNNLWGFYFEVTLESDDGEEIMHYESTNGTLMTESDPLRPSSGCIIEADIDGDINESTHTLKGVKVVNTVCVQIAPSIQL